MWLPEFFFPFRTPALEAVPGGRVRGTLSDHPLLFGDLSRTHRSWRAFSRSESQRNGSLGFVDTGLTSMRERKISILTEDEASDQGRLVWSTHLTLFWLFINNLPRRFWSPRSPTRGVEGRNSCAKWVLRVGSCKGCICCPRTLRGVRAVWLAYSSSYRFSFWPTLCLVTGTRESERQGSHPQRPLASCRHEDRRGERGAGVRSRGRGERVMSILTLGNA